MRNLDRLSAEKILSIAAPESLFSRSQLEAKNEYRVLALRWHPDHQTVPDAPAVFGHIASLYKKAQEKITTGNWIEPCEKAEQEEAGIKKFRLENGALRSVNYISLRPFELGSMYIDNHSLTFEVREEFTDLFHNARKQMRSLKFKNETMAAEMSRYLPQVEEAFKTDNANVIKLRKTPDLLLLSDVIGHLGARMEPIEHVGWILNVLWNIACYLEWSGIAHNAISAETFFISPLRHDGMLAGGWWYAREIGKPLIALPDRSLQMIPPDIAGNGIADKRADLELIKAVGRELLGDAGGMKLAFDNTLPSVMTKWLNLSPRQRAIENYRDWKHEILETCFGAPRFVPMNLSSKDLYKEN